MRKNQKNKLYMKLLIIFTIMTAILFGNINSLTYTANAAAVKNGWVAANGTWYYYSNGVMLKNAWKLDSHGWCFLNAVNGSWVKDGWAKDSHGWCYIGTDGYWINHAYVAKDSIGYCIIGDDGYWSGQRQEAPSVIPISSVTLDKSTAKLRVGDTDTLTAEVLPENATNKKVIWTSSDISIASVDNTGKVTATGVGTAVISLTTQDGTKTASCTYSIAAAGSVLTISEVSQNDASIVYIEAKNNQGVSFAFGSGCIISADGKVITNYHVIDGAYNLSVTTKDGTVYSVDGILGYSKEKDIAVLKLKNASNLPVSILGDSSSLLVGDQIVAIGNPLGDIDKITSGNVLDMQASNPSLRTGDDIQISAPIDHGSSGGGLYNMKSQLVGITYALGIADNGDKYYFAIPISDVVPFLNITTLTTVDQLYAMNKPQINDIKPLTTEQTFDFQPYFFEEPRNISVKLLNVYSGSEANTIVQYENMFNETPRSDEQWILMKFSMKYNSGSGLPLQAYEVIFDDFFTKDGSSVPVVSIAAFSKDRYGHNIIDEKLNTGDQVEFWFGILVQKTTDLPVLRIGNGYDPITYETNYNWYSLN